LPVLAQIGQEIEVRIACLNLETDSRRAVAVANQDAIAQHAMDQVCRCAVEHDEIDVATDCCCQIGGKVDTQPFEGSRGITDEQYAKVNVAGRTGGPAPVAADEIHARQILTPAGEKLAQRLDQCG